VAALAPLRAPGVRPIDFQYSARGVRFEGPPRVVRCAEIVTLGVGAGAADAARGGAHLSPAAFQQLLLQAPPAAAAAGGRVVLVDVRNAYEHAVGNFAAPPHVARLLPAVRTTAELPAWVEAHAGEFEGAARVLTYCTGGVRCERFTALLRARFPHAPLVAQLEGGVVRYLEAAEAGALPGSSQWEGRLFLFDDRPPDSAPSAGGGAGAGAGAAVPVGRCLLCAGPWDAYVAWLRCLHCGMLVLVCAACLGGGEREAALARLPPLACALCAAAGKGSSAGAAAMPPLDVVEM
jgi:UPF0176 protein